MTLIINLLDLYFVDDDLTIQSIINFLKCLFKKRKYTICNDKCYILFYRKFYDIFIFNKLILRKYLIEI
jgi:hypothetical protein